MGEPEVIMFRYKEIAEALVKHQGIHEGLWSLNIHFGFQTTTIKVKVEEGESEEETLVPGVMIPLLKMGIKKQEKPNSFTVDAAEVNPPPKPKPKPKPPKP
jgi:hypothetical protein